MSSDRDALLATIVAHPDDDLPRLVYADWLEEHAASEADANRAAFIREQVAEYRSPEPWELPGRPPRPSTRLLDWHRNNWLSYLPKPQRACVGFERGFPDVLTLGESAAEFLDLLGRTEPDLGTVRRLVASDANVPAAGDWARLAAAPGFARFTRVRVEGWRTSGAEVAALLAGPHAARLESVECAGYLRDGHALFAAPAPPGLRRLAVTTHPYATGETGGPDVVRSALLRALTDLDIRAFGSGEAMQGIIRGGGPRGLVRLGVVAPDRGSVERFDLPCLRRLKVELNQVHGGPPVEPIAAALARAPGLAGLEALSVVGYPVSLTSFVRFVESDALTKLRRLDVAVDGSPDAIADYLLTSDAPLRFEKLCVGVRWRTLVGERLTQRYGDRLQPHTDAELEPTLRRLDRW